MNSDKKALLDTSFILTCVKQKIDFMNYLYLEGYSILIPKKVINELHGLAESHINAKLVLAFIKINNNKIKIIKLTGKNTDNSIINYAKFHPEIIIASLDKEIKSKTKNKKLVIRGKKKLEVI
ncbi:MAG: hypothetical protein AABX30_01985 [Nanoarchaeota archaeon]